MVCDDVKRIVYFYLDGALSDKKRTDFSSHLDECPDCGDRIQIQKKLRNFVVNRLARRSAPDSLRARLLQRFASIRNGISDSA